MINVVICDDITTDLNNTIKIVSNYFKKRKIEYTKHIFRDYDKSFKEFVSKKLPFTIYILDIETPSASGIDIARLIRKNDMNSIIIFLTGHEELGNILLKKDVLFLGFINKFDECEKRLKTCLDKALRSLNSSKIIKITDKNNIYILKEENILYITKDSFERKTVIHTDYTEYKVNLTLTEVSNMLSDIFVQSHRACFVNKNRIAHIDKQNRIIKFDNNDEIYLMSDTYKKELIK